MTKYEHCEIRIKTSYTHEDSSTFAAMFGNLKVYAWVEAVVRDKVISQSEKIIQSVNDPKSIEQLKDLSIQLVQTLVNDGWQVEVTREHGKPKRLKRKLSG